MIEKDIVEIFPRSSVPEGATIFPAVWAMKQKRRVISREIYRHKARLNLDGPKQKAGVDYNQTYAPVAG